MRMRNKKNLIPRMERCAAVQVKEPQALRGRWGELLPGCREVRSEIGCGKGAFTAGTAQASPEALLVAIEKVPNAMVTAMERVCAEQIPNGQAPPHRPQLPGAVLGRAAPGGPHRV